MDATKSYWKRRKDDRGPLSEMEKTYLGILRASRELRPVEVKIRWAFEARIHARSLSA